MIATGPRLAERRRTGGGAAPKDVASLDSSRTWRSPGCSVLALALTFTALVLFVQVWQMGLRWPHLTVQKSSEQYSIVLDAGSTGSRVHVFRFGADASVLPIAGGSEFFLQVKPGIGSFRDDPAGVRASMHELMAKAMATVPEGVKPTVQLGATAGLRLLPDGQRAAILKHVEAALREFPVAMPDGSIRILDAEDEGAFQWLTVRALLDIPVVVDWGGASMQIAFPVQPSMRGKSKTYRGPSGPVALFCESFLGKGLMALRARVLELEGGFPCVAEGAQVSFKLGAQEQHGSGLGCARCAQAAARAVATCGDRCNIVRPSPGMPPGEVALTSFFFDRAEDAGLASPPEAWLEVGAYGTAAAAECANDVSSFLALDLALAQAALDALGLGAKRVRLLKQLAGPQGALEVAWPLGLGVSKLPL